MVFLLKGSTLYPRTCKTCAKLAMKLESISNLVYIEMLKLSARRKKYVELQKIEPSKSRTLHIMKIKVAKNFVHFTIHNGPKFGAQRPVGPNL